MFRPLFRTSAVIRPISRRTLFTSSRPVKRSGFKSTLLRWGAAGCFVYWYSLSPAFADDATFYKEQPPIEVSEEDERPPSLFPDIARSRKDATVKVSDAEDDRLQTAAEAGVTHKGPAPEEQSVGEDGPELGGLEDEAGQEGAFNPETGEINWDCPCLGGMAHGPCGGEFRAAFSCFIFSTADPKGVDCIDKFKGMQNCFREHPEAYGDELQDHEEEEEEQNASLGVLDLNDSESTRSPATSAVEPTAESYVKPEKAKPDTEPVGEEKEK